MNVKEIDVVVTMDCEPTLETTHPTATGPRDFGHSERAITGYWEICRSYGLPVTFFVHPETVIEQAAMFKQLQAEGCCIGLHMHPWKYAMWRYGGKRYLAHFGELTELDQVALLSEALALWHGAMGERPLYFRPGTFSANDATFKVLAELGFRGGSVSAPNRVFHDIRTIWTGTEPDPHRGHRAIRQFVGDLPFGNMPLSADYSVLLTEQRVRKRHADFRPDVDWPGVFGISYRTIAENTLGQVLERAPAVPVLNTISHNQYEYRDPADAYTQRFRLMLDEIFGACERASVKPFGATVATVTEKVLAQPVTKPEFCYF
jgi:peptidoglycan/xylan/chitin deacetylase (PgdA/CDA1 family)